MRCSPRVIVAVVALNYYTVYASEEELKEEGRVLTTFIFPLFKQYQHIDLGENLNKLKTADSAAFFILRDAMTVS